MTLQRKISKFTVATAAIIVLVFVSMLPARKKENKKQPSTGERFHHQTSLTWRGVLGDVFGAKPKKPPQYKTYPG